MVLTPLLNTLAKPSVKSSAGIVASNVAASLLPVALIILLVIVILSPAVNFLAFIICCVMICFEENRRILFGERD